MTSILIASRDQRTPEYTESESGSKSEHSKALLQGLQKLQDQNLLCDVTINVGGRQFSAHKAILAACGEFFLAMFTSGFKEKSDQEITISGSAGAFQLLLDYAYTGNLDGDSITTSNMYDVIELACYTQFTNFGKACVEDVVAVFEDETDRANIAVSDAYKIYLHTRDHEHMEDVKRASIEFLEDHAEGLKNLDTFLQNASFTFLEEFLCREYLSNESEEKQVLEMVINWLHHDWDNRRIHSHALLQKVRLGLVAADDIRDLIGPDILAMEGCSDLVDHVLQLQASRNTSESLSHEDANLFTTRSTITAPILSVRREGKKQFEFFNEKRGCWMDLDKFAPLPNNASHFSTIVVDGDLFAAGGVVKVNQQKVIMKDFYRYHPSENRWVTLESMTKARRNFHMVYLDGFIYVIGDYHKGSNALRNVERYSIVENNKWELVADLPQDCQIMSAVVFEGRILVGGKLYSSGWASNEHKLMIYHVESNTWQCEDFGNFFRATPHHRILSLFVHNKKCYRILYNFVEQSEGYAGEFLGVPTVHAVDMEFLDDNFIVVSMGAKISQDGMLRDQGMFRIGDEVFAIQKGLILNIGLKMGNTKYLDTSDVSEWSMFHYTPSRDRTNVTLFTFDRKKLSKDTAYDDDF